MADSFEKLAQQQVPNSATTIYTVPASTQTIVKHIRVVNPSGADATIKIWHDGNADINIILPFATVLAGGWAEFDGVITMETGDTLQTNSGTNNALTITVYGDEVT